MGYNAGGYGTITFPNATAFAAWKTARVSHGAWTDWTDELESTWMPEETVAERLARIAAGHSPKNYEIQEIVEQGLTLTLAWDTGEDQFRESAGDFAALFRSAAQFGATGSIYFLGTAGAEYDFAYEVALAEGEGTVETLEGEAIGAAYESPGYAAFMQRVTSMFMADSGIDPSVFEVASPVAPEPATASAPPKPAARKPAATPSKKAASKPAATKSASKTASKKTTKSTKAKKAVAKSTKSKKTATKPTKKKRK